jgi:hypothetical protein
MVQYVNRSQLVLVGERQSSPEAYSSPYIWVTGRLVGIKPAITL